MASFDDQVGASLTAPPEGDEGKEAEYEAVKKLQKQYNTAREFDKDARKMYSANRMVASGKKHADWASSANLIGSFIDILVSYLYSKNPDVSCRPAPRVRGPVQQPPPMLPGIGAPLPMSPGAESTPPLGAGATSMGAPMPGMPMEPMAGTLPPPPPPPDGQPTSDDAAFADTLEIVISSLWKRARLKKTLKKMVRSVLAAGPGWCKIVMLSDTKQNPEIAKQMKGAQDNLARLQAAQKALSEEQDSTELMNKQTEVQQLVEGLAANLEELIYTGLAIDYVRPENMQTSLDVEDVADYLDANWNANDLYIQKEELRTRFPNFTEEQCKAATEYHMQPGCDPENPMENRYAKAGTVNMTGKEKAVPFCKIVELWDHRDNMVKTFVDGIHCWARAPYAPGYASTRFFPYFRLAFYEVDGERHPQSLTERLAKLQDEYSSARSNGRLTRERSVPGTIFNRGQLSEEDAKKIEGSVHQEMIGIHPTNPDIPLQNVIAEKPVARIDPAIFDTDPIRRDMEVISGVQEAQQGAVQTAKTATEAQIQQSGFGSRTSTDRDTLEDMLQEMAEYTAELAVQCLTPDRVAKMAGPGAFWPFGMDVEDVLNMLNVEIEAGSTGKPNTEKEAQNWSTVLPQLTGLMQQVRMLQATDPQMAQAMTELLLETLHRIDDRLVVERFIPSGQPPLTAALGPGAPVPGGGGASNAPGIPKSETQPPPEVSPNEAAMPQIG